MPGYTRLVKGKQPFAPTGWPVGAIDQRPKKLLDAALMEAINHLVSLGYCGKIAWSDPIPTGRSGEYLSIMIRRRGLTTGG